jgi:single-strand selective monofunctional uracil DNA glycosylase
MSATTQVAEQLIQAADNLSKALAPLTFAAPVTHIYDPLQYARAPHVAYLKKFGGTKKRVIFLGMNPGPFGMVQVGVPFGEVAAVRDWMGINTPVEQPKIVNPARPIEGFACERSEVSGRRLWGLFQTRFGTAEKFFTDHFVANYCPLAFFENGRNLTPDKLPTKEAEPLYAACDEHLRKLVTALQPEWVIGVGAFAEARIKEALATAKLTHPIAQPFKIGRVLHPSPASPAANKDWAGAATKALLAQGVWE